MAKKILFMICDGMGDRLTEGQTPLEAAHIPNMDKLAKEGITGIMDTIRQGIIPGSDTAHLSLFGYDPYKAYSGRGPLEALGAGMDIKDGDVALRCNFSSIISGKIVDRRAGRYEYGLAELSRMVGDIEIDGARCIFKKCTGHRGALIIRPEGKGDSDSDIILSDKITDTDPEMVGVPPAVSKPLDSSLEAEFTADVLNKFTEISGKILNDSDINRERLKRERLPANVLVARGPGMHKKLPTLKEKYGISGAAIASMDLIRGVCRAINMDIIDVEGATGHVSSNISGKADAAINALEKYDFVFLHIKGTDEASHDGDFELKKNFIERIDSEVVGKLYDNLNLSEITIAITADHSTPVTLKHHSADPVPILIHGDVRTDTVTKFDERSCAQGDLNRIRGLNLINILLDISDRGELFGA